MRKIIGWLIEWFLMYPHTVYAEATSAYTQKPKKSYIGDAGYDMYCTEKTVIPALGYADIPVNTRFALPKGVYVLIKGRSSTLKKLGLMVTDSVIDNGYRGEMYACVYNTKDYDITVRCNDRISQIIPFRLIPLKFEWGKIDVHETDRGPCGFGSSGRN